MSAKPKIGRNRGNAGQGRPKGSPNKTTALLKDAILQAAERAGGTKGMVGYLQQQAVETPGPFLALLGKVLPMQVAHSGSINTSSSKEQKDAAVAAAFRADA